MVTAIDQLVKEYQALLTQSESLSALERSVKLAWDVLGGRIVPTRSGLRFDPGIANTAELVKLLDSSATPRGASQVERWWEIVSAHPARGREHRRLRALVIDAALALTAAPEIASLANFSRRRYSLLNDSCLLVAHQAYFSLLPKLDGQAFSEERAFLLSALQRFANSSSDPADRFALLALYFDAMDEPHRASEARRAALAATAADAHDFLTVLQSCWTSHIERGMLDEALDLLLETYPRVSRRDLDEVGELIRRTFHHATAVNGHSQRRAKPVRPRGI